MKIGRVLFLLVVLLLTISNSAQAASEQESVCDETYIVRPGDNLRKIAGKCETTLADIMAWNTNITDINRIYVGQKINLSQPEIPGQAVFISPTTGVTGSQAQIQVRNFPSKLEIVIAIGEEGGGLFELESIKTDVNGNYDLDMLVTGDPGREWYVKVWLADVPDVVVTSEPYTIMKENPKDGPVVYTVERGDSLSKIAKRFNRTTSHLLVANPEIANPNRIYPGQEILIPGDSEQVYTILAERPSEVAQAITNGDRWIEVDITHQSVHAWEGSELVRSFLVSTGKPSTPTVTGQYNIWIKLRYDDMRGPGYNLKDVPYVMYFYKGYGLHGTYWHNQFGTPRSAGCVNLRIEDAEWLYNFAEVGTLVDVH